MNDEPILLDTDWRIDPSGTRGHYPSTDDLATAMRLRKCPTDRAFDHYLPADLRSVSRHYWTPLAAAMRAGQWLDEVAVRSVVDIGSGAGKFCVAAGLVTRCRFTGVEHRPRLVAAARSLARTFGIENRITFVEGALGEVELPTADAYYLFNPFGENLYGLDGHLDENVELSEERYERDVGAVQAVLRDAPVGTYVVTYNGFGGHLPESYRTLRTDRSLPNVLRLSRKVVFADELPDWISFPENKP